jgi:hypothetical protein
MSADNPFGLALYDKQQREVTSSAGQGSAPPPASASNGTRSIHRRPTPAAPSVSGDPGLTPLDPATTRQILATLRAVCPGRCWKGSPRPSASASRCRRRPLPLPIGFVSGATTSGSKRFWCSTKSTAFSCRLLKSEMSRLSPRQKPPPDGEGRSDEPAEMALRNVDPHTRGETQLLGQLGHGGRHLLQLVDGKAFCSRIDCIGQTPYHMNLVSCINRRNTVVMH